MTDGFHLEELLTAAVFTGARVSGLMVFCPFLGSDAVPIPVKAGLVLLLTIILHPLHGPLGLALGPWQWVQVAIGEVMVGLLLGLVANFLFESAVMAGQILGVQIGYSLANVFDPQTQADTPVLSEFHQMAALLIFSATGRASLAAACAGAQLCVSAAGRSRGDAGGCQRIAACRGRNFPGGSADRGAIAGGHAGGGHCAWIFGQSVAAVAGDVYRTGGKKSFGIDRDDRRDRVLAAAVQPAVCAADSCVGTVAASGAVRQFGGEKRKAKSEKRKAKTKEQRAKA